MLGLPFDLNKAMTGDLEALSGIGPSVAGRIVSYRQTHGAFERLEDLTAIRGIGPATLRRLGPHLYVLDPSLGTQGEYE
jgi:competence protein ComEA